MELLLLIIKNPVFREKKKDSLGVKKNLETKAAS